MQPHRHPPIRTYILMECSLIHHTRIKSTGNNRWDLYRTRLLLPLLHRFHPEIPAQTTFRAPPSRFRLHLPTYMTPSLVLRAASSTPALVFSAAATTPSLAMENPFMKTSILDAGLVDDALQKDGAWRGLQRVRLFGGVLKASDDKRGRWFSAGTDGCTDALDGEGEREREASRRRRTRCRETEPAGCCSAFKSFCGYSPPPAHTFSHRHALPLTAMSRRLITYLLRCSALKPDALYNYDLFYVGSMCFYSNHCAVLFLEFEYRGGVINVFHVTLYTFTTEQ